MQRLSVRFSLHRKTILSAVIFFFALAGFGAQGQEFATVTPERLDLQLAQGESTVEQVSITIEPFCVRPFTLDVLASARDALVVNQSGLLVNNCGGDTSTFDISITGTGAAQSYDLQFVDAEFGGVLASIPVTIGIPAPCTLDIGLSFDSGTLNIDFDIGTRVPAELNLYLSAFNRTFTLLEEPVALPVVDPPLQTSVSISAFPDYGGIGILSTITTAEDGIICSAWQTVDSSPAR